MASEKFTQLLQRTTFDTLVEGLQRHVGWWTG
jgi:hypothetical protein